MNLPADSLMHSSEHGQSWQKGTSMTSVKSRLERLEKEQWFKRWFETHDFLKKFTYEELKTYADTGIYSSSIADRPSSLEGVNRKTLLKLFEEHESFFAGRSDEELVFYARHGYWPDGAEEDTKP
jgi:hypothetical protein